MARKCKYCLEDLGEIRMDTPNNKQDATEFQSPKEQKETPFIPKTVKIVIGLFLAALVIVFFVVNNSEKPSDTLQTSKEFVKQESKVSSIQKIIVGSWEGTFEEHDRKVTYQIDAREDGSASANIIGYIGGEEYAMGKYYIDYDGQMTGSGYWTISKGRCLIKWDNHTKKMHIRSSRGEGFNFVERKEQSATRQNNFNNNPADFYWLFPNFSVSQIDENTIQLSNLSPEGDTVSYGTSIILNRT